MRFPRNGVKRRQEAFTLAGGMNLISSFLEMQPGECYDAVNYEIGTNGAGYRRIKGYERFDGRPSPTDSTYWILNFESANQAVAVGADIDGASSGARGRLLVTAILTTGSYFSGNAAGHYVLTDVSGDFVSGENLEFTGTMVSKCAASASIRGETDDDLHDSYVTLAVSSARDLIEAVPGSGAIRGVVVYSGVTYAFRDNSGGTACLMYKQSSTGWTQVDLGGQLAYTSGGTTEIVVGNTITGATSGATAVVTKVDLDSGSWAGGNAAGTIWVNTISGTFQSENLNVGASTNLATISADVTLTTLSPGGRYEFEIDNFYGSDETINLYGVDGVNDYFEFDGTAYLPVPVSGITAKPNHLIKHRDYMFLAFPGGSIQTSAPGEPRTVNAVLGSAEIGVGDDVTGFASEAGALFISTRSSIQTLLGNTVADFVLQEPSQDAGAIEWTLQDVGEAFYLDDRGLSMGRGQAAFGNFKMSTVSERIEPFLAYNDRRKKVTASCVIRSTNHYRLFFSDNTFLMVRFVSGQVVGYMGGEFDHKVECAWSGEGADGTEVVFFGSDNGFVYQMEKGKSFDGEAIWAFLWLPYYHYGSPTRDKAFYKVELDIDADPTTVITVKPDFSYGDSDLAPSARAWQLTANGGGGRWNRDTWNNFVWSAAVISNGAALIDGHGKNMALFITSESATESQHEIQALIVDYTPRGLHYG